MRRWIIPSLVLICPTFLFLTCYGRAIFLGEQFAYRDAGEYYYPLHQRVQTEWDAGRWPLWEPEENGGMPLLGNPTAAVLYPGKLVFTLFRYPSAARLYVMTHTILAFASMIVLLRHWNTSWVGSTLGALAYAFGGPILFQSCNVIFLVGAAWLPLGLRAADRWVRLGRRVALAELAVVLSMQVLGGDPESAYLTGVCAGAYAVVFSWQGTKSWVRRLSPGLGFPLFVTLWCVAVLAAAVLLPSFRPIPSAGQRRPALPWSPWIGSVVATGWGLAGLTTLIWWRKQRKSGDRSILPATLLGLVLAAVVAASLSAAQLVPVLEFIGRSNRAAADGAHDIYPFSLSPVRVAEFVWPNLFGSHRHGNAHWLSAVPPRNTHANLWVDTLYLGGFTVVLALIALRARPGGEAAPWLVWMASITVIGLIGSFGEYGSPLWWARQVPGAESWIGPHDPGDPVSSRSFRFLRDGEGGVYWFLATGLPGFGQFRYPSKLLTFTVLGMAVLAAQGWDALASGDPRVRRRTAMYCAGLLLVSLAGLALTIARREEFLAWLSSRKLTTAFGPFDALAALRETQASLSQTAVVLAIALGICLRLAGRDPSTAGVLALLVTTVDLSYANTSVVMTVSQSVMDATPEVASIIERAEKERPRSGPFRVHRVPIWGPRGWTETRSPNRVSDFVTWAIRTAEPKYGINHGIQYTTTLGVTELYDVKWFFSGFPYGAREKAARVLGVEQGTPLVVYPRRAFDLWNTRYFILPYATQWDDEFRGIASFIEHTERIHPPPDAFQGADGRERERAWVRDSDYQVRRNLTVFPRAWVVHDARWLPPFRGLSRAGRDRSMEEMLFSNDMAWPDPTRTVHDARQYAWLEDSVRAELAASLPGGYPAIGETVKVVRYESDRVELEAVLERPGIVVLADVHDPGWSLTIDGQPAPVYRANVLMRGAAVTAGRHTLIYTFRPASFRIGLVVSGLGLAMLSGLVLWSFRTSRA